VASAARKEAPLANGGEGIPQHEEEGVWCITNGDVTRQGRPETFLADGTENLTYNNPYGMEIERVWFDGKIVYAIESGEVELEFDEERVPRANKVAQEYQVVNSVELDERGKLRDGREPERVEGQYNIYDSIPGMDDYSPLWQFNFVVVPDDYEPNTLRSEADCRNSGYRIEKSTIVEN
jgi:hypothetical protein